MKLPTPHALSVAFVLLPEFTLHTFAGFVDALRIAADVVDGSRQIHCGWTILGADRSPVRSSCGVEVSPWGEFRDPREFDYVVVVGGLVKAQKALDRRVIEYLRLAARCDRTLVGICTGSFALARAQLLANHRCCVHWAHRQQFMETFPNLKAESDTLYVMDGQRITCAGGQGAIDVAGALISRHCGARIVRKLTVGMMIDGIRGLNHPQPHQEAKWFLNLGDFTVQRAVLLIDQSMGRPRRTTELAKSLAVSVRKLERAFRRTIRMSPAQFSRLLRVAHAHCELRNRSKSIATIAAEFGFCDSTHFGQVHRSWYGTSPSAARRVAAEKRGGGVSAVRRRATVLPLVSEILEGDLSLMESVDWKSGVPLHVGASARGRRKDMRL
jgi:transcriptional regulator GlxA family with amidase domain